MMIARRHMLGVAAGWAVMRNAPANAAPRPGVATFTYSTLHDFSAEVDGPRGLRRPIYGVQLASDGRLYGLVGAQDNPGVSFRLATAGGDVEVLHRFPKTAVDGTWPYGRLLEGPDGHLYGVSLLGGAFAHGTVFRMHPNGHVRILHDF